MEVELGSTGAFKMIKLSKDSEVYLDNRNRIILKTNKKFYNLGELKPVYASLIWNFEAEIKLALEEGKLERISNERKNSG